MVAIKSPLVEWKIKSRDLKIKYNLIAHTLALMYDYHLSIKISGGIDENIIRGGSLPISSYFS
ncbi:hypothetical protein RhiirC2_723411, partial [Rhizophagus irregularis]